MAKFNLYLKDSQGWGSESENKTNLSTAILLYVSYSGNRIKLHTKYTSKPSQWNFKKQRYKTTKELSNAINLNERLNNIIVKAESAYLDYLRDNESIEPTPSELKEKIRIYLKYRVEKKQDLFTFFQHYIDAKKADMEAEGKKTKDLITSYKSTLQSLKDYSIKYRVDVDFNTVDLDFYKQWKTFLLSKYSVNQSGKLINRLKTVLKAATALNINKSLYYTDSTFKVISEDVDEIYLSEAELNALKELDLPAELQKVRDSFILMCWTGVRVSDFPQLNASNVYNGSFQIQQQKTKGRVSIPIFPEAHDVLIQYDYKMPAETDQAFNRKLKQLGKKMNESNDPRLSIIDDSGLKKDYSGLKSKCGRRSLATNLVLRRKPAKAIMSMTGHTTEKSFWKYVKLEPGSFKEILMEKPAELKIAK